MGRRLVMAVVGGCRCSPYPVVVRQAPRPDDSVSLGELQRRAVGQLAPALPLLRELGDLFAGAGHELSLVGGPVRDAFLGRTSQDLDLTTSARPERIEGLLKPWADTT